MIIALLLFFTLLYLNPVETEKYSFENWNSEYKNERTTHQTYDRKDELSNYPDLLSSFGNNKELPKGFELETLLALSHYPELKNTTIRFKVRTALVPLTSYVFLPTLLLPEEKRVYVITISSKSLEQAEPLLVKNLPFNGRIGIIGHELAHIADYIHRSNFEMFRVPFCSLNEECRKRFEQATDRRTIEHGLGWQLLEQSRYIREEFTKMGFNPNPDGEGTYYGPQQIITTMKEFSIYSNTGGL